MTSHVVTPRPRIITPRPSRPVLPRPPVPGPRPSVPGPRPSVPIPLPTNTLLHFSVTNLITYSSIPLDLTIGDIQAEPGKLTKVYLHTTIITRN